MKLYHYTNIESLALILKNKKIRFSRLDTVDDPEEFQFERNGMNVAKYVFVSCWTKNERENIPQWKLYGDNCHGVRIELEHDMFPIEGKDNLFPTEYFKDKDYIIMPFLNTMEGQPLFDMIYTDDVHTYINKVFITLGVDFKELGLYKNKNWGFQEECRYKLDIFPKEKNVVLSHEYILSNNIELSFNHIDIPLKDEVFQNMHVMLGPCVNDAEKTIVESLMKDYLGNIDCQNSFFYGKVRG